MLFSKVLQRRNEKCIKCCLIIIFIVVFNVELFEVLVTSKVLRLLERKFYGNNNYKTSPKCFSHKIFFVAPSHKKCSCERCVELVYIYSVFVFIKKWQINYSIYLNLTPWKLSLDMKMLSKVDLRTLNWVQIYLMELSYNFFELTTKMFKIINKTFNLEQFLRKKFNL